MYWCSYLCTLTQTMTVICLQHYVLLNCGWQSAAYLQGQPEWQQLGGHGQLTAQLSIRSGDRLCRQHSPLDRREEREHWLDQTGWNRSQDRAVWVKGCICSRWNLRPSNKFWFARQWVLQNLRPAEHVLPHVCNFNCLIFLLCIYLCLLFSTVKTGNSTSIGQFEDSMWYLRSNGIHRYRFKTHQDSTIISSGAFTWLRSLKIVHPFKQPGKGAVINFYKTCTASFQTSNVTVDSTRTVVSSIYVHCACSSWFFAGTHTPLVVIVDYHRAVK